MKVSVVIPCHNASATIERAVNSVLHQSEHSWELILVENNSGDDTRSKMEGIKARHPQVILLEEKKPGANAARNAGLDAASGTYLQFLDADDELLPDKLSVQAGIARETHADLVIGDYQRLSAGGSEIIESEKRDPWLGLFSTRLGITSSILWKREAVVAAGKWKEGLASGQEYELMFRLLQAGARLSFDPKLLTRIYDSRHGISNSAAKDNAMRYVRLRLEMLKHLASIRNEEELMPFYASLLEAIRTLARHDSESADEMYRIHIPAKIRARLLKNSGRAYRLLHDLFGFRNAERMRRLGA